MNIVFSIFLGIVEEKWYILELTSPLDVMETSIKFQQGYIDQLVTGNGEKP